MTDIGSGIRQRLLALPSVGDQELAGASDEDITELENYAGGRLPAVYKQFLKQLGRSAGELFRGSEYALSQKFCLHLKEHAEELLKRKEASFTLPQSAFVFLMSQGYQFTFFNLDEGDDPTVYHYLEGNLTPKVLDAKLSQYLLRCIEACEQREQRLGSSS
jgi:SMI1-KNR4 cell-wall